MRLDHLLSKEKEEVGGALLLVCRRVNKIFAVAIRNGETPVLIPNTTVKPGTAESTLLETAREDRWLQLQINNADLKSGIVSRDSGVPADQGSVGQRSKRET